MTEGRPRTGRVSAPVAALACLALLALPFLYLVGMDGEAIDNGDEAIYAQMAREMVATGRPSELTFDGESVFPRPPAAIWAIAAGYALGGSEPPEPALRWVGALLCALEVALTILLGTLLFGPYAGVVAGGLLATADLFVGYARVYESEPLLCCFVLAAFCAYAGAERRPRLVLLYGAALGGALLTKQLVGFLPLLAPIVGWRSERDATSARRQGMGLALVVAVAVAAPWHVLMTLRHGAPFLDSFFVRSLVGRAGTGLLHRTQPTFYLRELIGSEGWMFSSVWLLAALAACYVGVHRRRAAVLLVGAWPLGVLVVYSLARSRYDYYLLLAYPGFALAAAWLLSALPLRPALRVAIAVVLVATAAIAHLPRNLVPPRRDGETRQLLVAARAISPGAPLYTFNTHPYAARVYGDRRVRVFVDSPRDLAAAETLRLTGMPAPAELASPPQRALTIARRPSLLLLPRARGDVLDGAAAGSYELVAETPRLKLLLLR